MNNVVPGAIQHSKGKFKRGTRKKIQQQHLLLLHAYKCQQRGAQALASGEVWNCNLASCKKMKKQLHHMIMCPSEKKCTCSSLRQLMKSLTNCKKEDCPVCIQKKQWQMSITAEQRSHIVDLLVQAEIHNDKSSPEYREKLFRNKIRENDMYNMANTLTEYYGMLAARKWDVEMNVEETARALNERFNYRRNTFIQRRRVVEYGNINN